VDPSQQFKQINKTIVFQLFYVSTDKGIGPISASQEIPKNGTI
jgi:hypothetical protein